VKRRSGREREQSLEDERAKNAGLNESEIDQVLADSFPASDAPSWTLGVTAQRAGLRGSAGFRRRSRGGG
jgi:hypothetical protein